METLTTDQRDTLDALARRLHTASLAVNALGATLVHDAVASAVLDVARDLEALTVARAARRVVARQRIGGARS
jgi:hypothetical protein